MSKPYEERRSYVMMRKLWAEVEVLCGSTPMDLEEYADSIGDAHMVIDTTVGALQRVLVFPDRGPAVEQDVPDAIVAHYERLCAKGFTGRLLPSEVAARPRA